MLGVLRCRQYLEPAGKPASVHPARRGGQSRKLRQRAFLPQHPVCRDPRVVRLVNDDQTWSPGLHALPMARKPPDGQHPDTPVIPADAVSFEGALRLRHKLAPVCDDPYAAASAAEGHPDNGGQHVRLARGHLQHHAAVGPPSLREAEPHLFPRAVRAERFRHDGRLAGSYGQGSREREASCPRRAGRFPYRAATSPANSDTSSFPAGQESCSTPISSTIYA